MAKMTGGDTEKQGANRLATVGSSTETARTAVAVERIASGWGDRSHAVKVLRALCDLAVKQPMRLDSGLDPEEWGFLAMEIGEALHRFKIPGAEGWATDPDKAKSRMNEHWPKLEDLWERQRPTITDGLDAEGIALRPHLFRKEGGGAGRSTRYGFRFDAIEDQADEKQPPNVDLLDVPQVRYRRQDISGNRLVRWMSDRGLYLGGWGGRIYRRIRPVGVLRPPRGALQPGAERACFLVRPCDKARAISALNVFCMPGTYRTPIRFSTLARSRAHASAGLHVRRQPKFPKRRFRFLNLMGRDATSG